MSAENVENFTNRVSLGRYPERGRYDFETIAAILDAGLVCHVGIVSGDQPIVLPTIYGRIDDHVYLHGSAVARWLNSSINPAHLCVTVSILDALVLARSAYQHSLNYRSVVILGQADAVVDKTEKIVALRAIVEHVCPGRWRDVRPPSDSELRATAVLRVPIVEASAKIRTGTPTDFESDLASEAWAGLVPLRTVRGTPVRDPTLADHIGLPPYLAER